MATTQAQVHVKSYFARSVPDAIESARLELGPDAMLLNTRESPPEARHLGALEVVFGGYQQALPDSPAAAPSDSLEDLRRKVDEIRTLLIRNGLGGNGNRSRPPLVEQALLDAGLTAGLAAEIEEAVAERLSRRSLPEIARVRKLTAADPDAVLEETLEELESRFEVRPALGRITALVGPPGAGKTTTIVKLAAAQGLAQGRPVCLISADMHRIAAVEQLRTYAAILGVPFQSVETTAALSQAIDSAPATSLLFIDTTGFSAGLMDGSGSELANFLASRQEIDTHLVLTASMRQGDLENAAKRFDMFCPTSLIFTKLDETDSFGAVFCEAARSNRPVSFLCDGQLIPENIEPARKTRILQSLVRQLRSVLCAAA